MEKKLYKVPVTWKMAGTYYIRASSPEAATDAAYQAPLPNNGDYVAGSFSIDEDAEVQEEKYYKPKNVIEADED